MSGSIRAEAAGFDDEALAALASAGLVRRAAKLGPVTMASEDEQTTVVHVGEEAVTFAAGAGIASGSCTCPTVGPCQHLLAAILHLRHGADGERDGGAASVETLAEVDDAELGRFAGRGGLRWAVARLEGLDLQEIAVRLGPPVVVELPGTAVRFMGPTLESAFCDPSSAQDRRQITLALLLLRVRSGHQLPEVDRPAPRPVQAAGRTEAVEAARRAAVDAISVGIAHLSPALAERFDSLSVGARGAQLHRLAQLAARIATGIDQLVERNAAADTGQLLADLALLHTLAEATAARLEHDQLLPEWLVGTARSEYHEAGSLDLLGLGAYPWSTMSGYAGITGVFYEPARGRFLEVGQARPGAVPTAGGMHAELLGWEGSVSLQSIGGHRLRLANASVSSSGRISTGSRTRATLQGAWVPSELTPAAWDGSSPEPASRLRGERRGRWSVIAVDQAGPATFDEVAQRLDWRLRSRGRELTAVIGWSAVAAGTVEAVERLGAGPVSHVVGRMWTEAGRALLTPISAIADGRLHVLAFDDVAERRGRGRRRLHSAGTPAPNSSLERLGGRVLQVAERGLDEQGGDLLPALAAQASTHGFALVGRSLADESASPPVRLLRAAHVVEEHRQLSG